jgi:hypothetical protein
MAREAALFRVEGPRGIYYAVYEVDQQTLFTEANEKGARDHAAESGLTLLRERTIRHAELMRLTGRDAAPVLRAPAARSEKPEKAADMAHKPLVARLPKNEEGLNNGIVSSRILSGGNPFASAAPVKQTDEDVDRETTAPMDMLPSEAVKRDVINLNQLPKTGRRGNPFADHSKK